MNRRTAGSMPLIGDLAQMFSREHSSSASGSSYNNNNNNNDPRHHHHHPPRHPQRPQQQPSRHRPSSSEQQPDTDVVFDDEKYNDESHEEESHEEEEEEDEYEVVVVEDAASSFFSGGAEHVYQVHDSSKHLYRHSWDSDSQFPIQEIERIRLKTKKLRSTRQQQQQQHQQQLGNSSSSTDHNAHIFRQDFFAQDDEDEDDVGSKVRAFEQAKLRQQQQARQAKARPGGTKNRSSLMRNDMHHHAWSEDVVTAAEAASAAAASLRQQPHDSSNSYSSSAPDDEKLEQQQQRTKRNNNHNNSTSSIDTPPTSRAAQLARQALLQGFHSVSTKRLQKPSTSSSSMTPLPSVVSSSQEETTTHNTSSTNSSRGGGPPFRSNNDQSLCSEDQRTVNTTASEFLGEEEEESATLTTQNENSSSNNNNNLQLHDLCGEAASPDDIAWRNALHLISVEPELALVREDDQGWTPLHICCLGSYSSSSSGSSRILPAPSFMIRALLYVHKNAARWADRGGRLPLHLVAASSGHVETMQLLVQEYPQAVCHKDGHGLTPLHLMLRNLRVELTLERARILLGLTTATTTTTTTTNTSPVPDTSSINNKTNNNAQSPPSPPPSRQQHVLQRRKEHLQLNLEQLEQMQQQQQKPKRVNFYDTAMLQSVSVFDRDMDHEANFETYPQDVQTALRRLSQWKRRQRKQHDQQQQDEVEGEEEAIELELTTNAAATATSVIIGASSQARNPAAIPAPNTLHLPIHTLVYRAIVDREALEQECNDLSRASTKDYNEKESVTDDDEEEEEQEDDDDEVSSSAAARKKQTPTPSVRNPLDVLRLFVACYPEGLVCRDADGLTPLLVTLVDGKVLPGLDVIEVLLGKQTGLPYETALPAWAQDIPLQLGGRDPQQQQQQQHLLPRYRNPAMIATRESRQLPLHFVAEEMRDVELIRTIYEAYPGATQVQDHRGRTPLHVAFGSYRRIPVHPQVVAMLFSSDRVAQIRDDRGQLPFDLLLNRTQTLPAKQPRTWSLEDVFVDDDRYDSSSSLAVSSVYQKFISASILGASRPRSRAEADEFLRRIRSLPPWLREQACSTTIVQELVLENLTNPWKCFLVLWEGVLIVTIITVFRLQMEQFVIATDNQEELSTWYTYAVYATTALKFMILLFRWLVTYNLGEFQHLVLFDLWGWIDVAALFVTITTSVLLYSTRSIEELYSLGTASTGLLWISLMGYLSNWSYGVAVFFGGLSKISSYLVWPFIIFGALVVAFSQMFYTLLQVNCDGAIGDTPVCSVRQAYRVVYMLVRGESLVDGFYQISAQAIVLIAFFLLFLALFILSLFVMLVVASFKLDFESIALRSWWEKKLAYHYTASDLGLPERLSWNGRVFCSIDLSDRLEQAWNLLIISLVGGAAKKRKHWYAGVPTSDFLSWPLWIVAIIIVPVWIAVGLVTFGLLWPPQLRRFLFRPIGFNPDRKTKSSLEQTTSRVSEMHEEIRQLKLLSLERSGDVERELRELKELLHSAIKEES